MLTVLVGCMVFPPKTIEIDKRDRVFPDRKKIYIRQVKCKNIQYVKYIITFIIKNIKE
jgi:hypothetical protein